MEAYRVKVKPGGKPERWRSGMLFSRANPDGTVIPKECLTPGMKADKKLSIEKINVPNNYFGADKPRKPGKQESAAAGEAAISSLKKPLNRPLEKMAKEELLAEAQVLGLMLDPEMDAGQLRAAVAKAMQVELKPEKEKK